MPVKPPKPQYVKTYMDVVQRTYPAFPATQPLSVNFGTMSGQVSTLGQPLFLYETPDGYPDAVEYWSGNMMPRWTLLTITSTVLRSGGGSAKPSIESARATFS